jgi:hypothetical protein
MANRIFCLSQKSLPDSRLSSSLAQVESSVSFKDLVVDACAIMLPPIGFFGSAAVSNEVRLNIAAPPST